MKTLLTRRRLLTAAALGGATLAAGCALRARPAADAHAFDTGRSSDRPGERIAGDGFAFVEADWRDDARGREVPVRLYLPDAATPHDALPLVLFSHGLGGSRRGYRWLGTHFARHGFASLHVQHVGSDRALWGGSPFELAERLRAAARDGEAVDRVRDLRFALDRLLGARPGDPLYLRVDARRIVAAGHSYGANTALLASGAQVMRDGSPVRLRDRRIATAILMSAPPFYGEAELVPILRPVALPTLHVTTTADDIRVPGYASGVDDRIAVFDAIGGPLKALAVFEGGSHSIFTDRATPGGPALNARVKGATQELALAFLDAAFDGRPQPLRDWQARHAALLARFSARGS